MTRVSTFPDLQAAAEHTGAEIAGALREALERRGVAHLALSGGNSPRPAYEALAGLLDDWSAVRLWYCDERCVPPDDPESTHRLVRETLLAPIAALGRTPPREHRVQGELEPEQAAHEYERELRAAVASDDGNGPPILDVALLGIGEDGHTASLFPGHPQVTDDSDALCLPVRDSPKPPPERVTLTLPVLRAARRALLLVAGAGKADALAAMLRGPDPRVPASLVASERLHVLADMAAVGRFR
ncbi:MAG TPA: 6-phosphogluconolactonase [Solirubrobacteraceae bacterium]|nr:6-phosphogluconolactonase [Solirubrobacteraceae bacterium]